MQDGAGRVDQRQAGGRDAGGLAQDAGGGVPGVQVATQTQEELGQVAGLALGGGGADRLGVAADGQDEADGTAGRSPDDAETDGTRQDGGPGQEPVP